MNTLCNNWHGTSAQTRATDEELDAIQYRLYEHTATEAEKALRRRLWVKLCGRQGCLCGDDFGRRLR